MKQIFFIIISIIIFYISVAYALEKTVSELTELSLEELMEIEVTSVSKKTEKLSETAAAIYVITKEDIKRSGATTIADILRMVPGIEVAQVNSNMWAVTSRGFNGRYANKLLVLIDGRSVYTPQFSGVYWDVQNIMLENIERIEVIRGPGAAMWGANAVNGIINIITKNAKDTQGWFISTGGGNEEKGFGNIRYGGKIKKEDIYYRVHAKYFKKDSFVNASGEDMQDQWYMLRGGFRIDWNLSDNDNIMLSGDIYDGKSSELVNIPSYIPLKSYVDKKDISGANILGRWEHTLSDTSKTTLQIYYDWTKRKSILPLELALYGYNREYIEDVKTFDIDFQHQFRLSKHQEILWGLGYRLINDYFMDDEFAISIEPDERHYDILSAFIQDEITLIKERLKLIIGSKFEHNDFTGYEIQPNIRLVFKPSKKQTLWCAVSRAVRTPSRYENDAVSVIQEVNMINIPVIKVIVGSNDLKSEELIAYELGYRLQPIEIVSISIATFYNMYDNLRTFEKGTPYTVNYMGFPSIVIPFKGANKMEGKTYGIEIATNYQLLKWWRIYTTYSFLQMQLNLDRDSTDIYSESIEDKSPHNKFSIRSAMNIGKNVIFDTAIFYVDNVAAFNIGNYFNLNVYLGWKPKKNLELSIVGLNLLDEHPEFKSDFMLTPLTEIQRSIYGKITWRF